MAVEQVVEKILADAGAEAEKITSQARAKQQAAQAQFQAQLADYQKQTEALARNEAKDKRQRILAAARMDFKKQLLAAKREILDGVFAAAAEKFKNMPDDRYCRLISRLMADAVQTGDEEILVDKNDTRINYDFIKQVNRQLGSGFKGNLRLAEQRENLGSGFILKRGRIKTNVSIAVLLAQARESLEIDLAKQLFG